MSQFPETLRLADLTQDQGFSISRTSNSGMMGYSLGFADMNGDGYSDIMLSAPYANYNGTDTGAAYVLFGGPEKNASISLDINTNINGDNAFTIRGGLDKQHLGLGVGTAGDVNGDKVDDMIVQSDRGEYIVFGRTDGFSKLVDINDLDGTNGFKMSETGDVSSAGDYNGDGIGDLVLSDGANVAVLYGHAGAYADKVNPYSPAPAGGFVLSVDSAAAVAAAGDVDGDGYDDILIGAPGGPSSTDSSVDTAGKAYLLFGSAQGGVGRELILQDSHASANDIGAKVAPAGDFNGDGLKDMAVYDSATEQIYLVYGRSAAGVTTVELGALHGSDGFLITGGTLNGAVDGAGDINGDGFDDLIIGTASNKAYVLYGHRADASGVFDNSELDGQNGFTIDGYGESYNAGFAVSSAGDMNGDGLSDLMVSSPEINGKYAGPGTAYLIWGQGPDGDVRRIGTAASQHLVGGDGKDQLLGVGGDDSLYGGAAKDKLSGGGGKDVLYGGGGGDVLSGGSGKDLFVFKALADSSAGAPDTITDLSDTMDRISLGVIDADTGSDADQAFHRVAAFTGKAGELVTTYHTTGAYAGFTTVEGDVDGDKAADLTLLISGDHHDFARFVL